MKQKDRKITFDDLADELMFEVYQKMLFRAGLPEEGNMKKVFKKYFRKAIKIFDKTLIDKNGTESTNTD